MIHTARLDRPAPTCGHDNLVIVDDKVQRPVRYLDQAGVGKWFGVPGTTVAQWRFRYAPKRDKDTGEILDPGHPTPVEDVIVGRTAGWAPDREPEWREWYASRPGQGAGGGRPRK